MGQVKSLEGTWDLLKPIWNLHTKGHGAPQQVAEPGNGLRKLWQCLEDRRPGFSNSHLLSQEEEDPGNRSRL